MKEVEIVNRFNLLLDENQEKAVRDAASAVGVKRVTFGREKESSFFWKEHGSLPYCKVLSWEESEEKGKVRTRVLFCLVLVKNSEINYCKLYPMVGKTESLIHEVSVYNAPTEVESYVRDSIEEIAKFLGLYGVHLGSLESDYEDDDGEYFEVYSCSYKNKGDFDYDIKDYLFTVEIWTYKIYVKERYFNFNITPEKFKLFENLCFEQANKLYDRYGC